MEHRLLRIWAPLKPSVWMMIFISFLVTSIILYVVSYFNPYEWRRMSHDREATLREGESFTCMNSFWFAISALMWQGNALDIAETLCKYMHSGIILRQVESVLVLSSAKIGTLSSAEMLCGNLL